jgi:thioesterase domain-containing protein
MQTVQPAGPYLLGGWSMGGVVAFEMAQQLHAQGLRVALLALLDGRIPTPDETFPEEDSEAISLVERYFGISLGPMRSLEELPKEEQLAFILELAKSADLVPAELDVSQAHRFVEILRRDLRATQNYGLHLYPSNHLLRKERRGKSPDPTMGWSEWASGVEVTSFRATTPTDAGCVEVLAQKLTACLSQAQPGRRKKNAERSIDDHRNRFDS